MRTSRSLALAAILAATSCACAQPFWTLVGPVGFVERFDTPDTAAPDEVFGPPGYTLLDPTVIISRADAVAFVDIGGDNTVMRIQAPIETELQYVSGLEAGGADEVGATRPNLSTVGGSTEWFQVYASWTEAFFPAPGDPARVSADFRLTDPSEAYAFTAREPSFSQLGGIVYFGTFPGQNTSSPGAPDTTTMRYLATNGYPVMAVCADENGMPILGCVAPQGYDVGQPLLTPVGSWFSITIEDLADVRQRVYVDYHDGAGAILAGEMETIDITYAANRIIIGSTLGVPDATLYVDNIRAHGYVTTRYPDANGDRIIDFTDLNLVLSNFGTTTNVGYPFGDADNNQTVDFTDLNAILGAFGEDLNN